MHDEQICSRCHKVIISKIKSTSEKSL
jgi:hypothetical protein